MDSAENHTLHESYDSLWREAMRSFAVGRVRTDHYLSDREHDRRVGLTVLARPGRDVTSRISAMLRQLARIAPGQHVYHPEEVHITVLSLFTATEDAEPYFARASAYRAAVESGLLGAERFTVAFRGVTASPGTIMVQGFPCTETLDRLRGSLREALRNVGLGGGLDQRYRIKTAHATVMRFRTQPRNLERLVEALRDYREHDFGQTTFQTLQLVKNDWYMSSDKVEVLAEYPLS